MTTKATHHCSPSASTITPPALDRASLRAAKSGPAPQPTTRTSREIHVDLEHHAAGMMAHFELVR